MEFRGLYCTAGRLNVHWGNTPTPEVRREVIKLSCSIVVERDPTRIVQLLYINNCT